MWSGFRAGSARVGRCLAEAVRALSALVLPVSCAGCGEPEHGLCPGCRAALAGIRPSVTCPEPAPPGLPRTVTVGGYGGSLRSVILAYKERGRYPLAGPLGDALAAAVATAVGYRPQGRSAGRRLPGRPLPGRRLPGPAAGEPPPAVLLVPVPTTAAAIRRRGGDHMVRLARRTALTLRRSGLPATVVSAVRARPRPDSAGLTATERARAAAGAYAVDPRRISALRPANRAGAWVVVVDDIVTTGATLAAVTARLRQAGVPVRRAAVLAATRRTGSSS